jgi:arginine-tRNA-protein transferase
MKDELGKRQFFITPEHPCSYLPERNAATLFLDPRDTITTDLYQQLADLGFRRSGGHLYRPHCQNCQACIPTRVDVARFKPRRSQRRVAKRNADLEIHLEPAAYTDEHYDLYARYVEARHGDGDMYPPTREQFRSFLLSTWSDTRFLTMTLDGEMVCVAVTDQQRDGLSSVYTFFDPDLADRSLGVMAILQQLELARGLKLPHLYLGYWISESAKMRYKIDYRPSQLFSKGRWLTLN